MIGRRSVSGGRYCFDGKIRDSGGTNSGFGKREVIHLHRYTVVQWGISFEQIVSTRYI